MRKLRPLALAFASAAVFVCTIVYDAPAFSQATQGDYPVIELRATAAAARTTQVDAVGTHDVQSSATLRARGCVGFVAQAPAVQLVFHDNDGTSVPVVRAEGDEDLVLLIGSANQAWYCNDNAFGTNPEIRLPPGSKTYSIWVGLRDGEGTAEATLTIRSQASRASEMAGGRCGESTARVPQGVSDSDWQRYSCEAAENAGPRWAMCLPRAAYSDDSEDGCPGAERCCPPAGFEPNTTPSMQGGSSNGDPVSGTCGDASARRPEGVSVDDWGRYQCQSPGMAGSRWTLCLARSAYSDMDGDGCPGIERCCPPDGFDPTASAEPADTESQPDDTEAESERPVRPADAPPPLARQADRRSTASLDPMPEPTNGADSDGAPNPPAAQREPSDASPGDASASTRAASTTTSAVPATTSDAGANALLVDTSPWEFVEGEHHIVWRGFETTISARQRPGGSGPIAFDFPVRPGMTFDVQRDWLVILEPRLLVARGALTLTDRVTGESEEIAAGELIRLLAAIDPDYCSVEYGSERMEVLCPSRQQFRGEGAPFEGLAPLAYRWFIMVEADNGEQGWIEVQAGSPHFDVVIR